MLTIDTRGLDSFLDALTEMSGKPRPEIVLNQVARVLEICIKRSPGSKSGTHKVAQLKAALRVMKPSRYVDERGTRVGGNNKVPRPLEPPYLQTLTGTRGGQLGNQWYVGRNRAGKRVFIARDRIAAGNWQKGKRITALQQQMEQQLEVKAIVAKNAVGSMAKSWLQIADRLGVDLRLPASSHIRKARTPYDDGARSRVVTDAGGFFAELVNTNSGLIRRYDAGAILYGAINTRLRAFAIEVKNDVFADITARARRYPGIFVAE